jgi:hypothetical protein
LLALKCLFRVFFNSIIIKKRNKTGEWFMSISGVFGGSSGVDVNELGTDDYANMVGQPVPIIPARSNLDLKNVRDEPKEAGKPAAPSL